MVDKRLANIDLPAPGGPIKIKMGVNNIHYIFCTFVLYDKTK